jgi:hypothetical protein
MGLVGNSASLFFRIKFRVDEGKLGQVYGYSIAQNESEFVVETRHIQTDSNAFE